MIDDKVLNHARNNLEQRIAALSQVQFSDVIQRDFPFGQIRKGFGRGEISACIKPQLGDVIYCAAIYRLTVNNQRGADRLRQAFRDFEPPDGHVLARNNHVTDSKTVYVGSSRKMWQRLQQHLHTSANGTYALKMHLWCPNADNSIKVEIQAVRGAVDASLIQDLEDALWKRSRPMFGKLGAR